MNFSLAIVTITSVINLLLLWVVFRYRDSESKNSVVWVLAGAIICVVLWSLCNYFADTSTHGAQALFWTRASFPVAFFMGFFVFILSSVFPVQRINMLYVSGYLIFSVLFSLFAMGPHIISHVDINPYIGVSGVMVGDLYLYILALYVAFILHSSYNFISNYRNLKGKQRFQVRSVLVGWSAFLLIAVITNAILPLFTGNANWSKFGPLGSVCMVGFITYAIVRHQFLNVNIIIQRGVIYSALLTIIVGVYLTLLFVAHVLFHGTSVVSVTISAFITTLIGIFGVPPLTQYFQRITAPLFFKDAYDYATVLESLAEVLNTNLVQDSLIKKTSVILQSALKAGHIAFLLTVHNEQIPEWSVVAIPLKSNKKHIGTLYLSSKRSGDVYTPEDMRLLKTFADSAGTALEKAVLYRKVKEHAETLERKVEERTAEIHEIQKGQESMMLEISHGLQTPLTIMKGELYFLRKQGYETTKVDTIDASIDRISFFITRLLNLYRLETTACAAPETFCFSELLKRVVESFHESALKKNAILHSDIDEACMLVGDAYSIEEMCSNLIENALKYSHPDRVNNVTVELHMQKHEIHLIVRDTGIGIKAEHMSGLCKKFYRAKEEGTLHIQGTGLGLAIVKKIVEMHHGRLELHSEYGTGTTIAITFPQTFCGENALSHTIKDGIV